MEARSLYPIRRRTSKTHADAPELQDVLAEIGEAKAELRAVASTIADGRRLQWAATICIHAISAYWVAIQAGKQEFELLEFPDGTRLSRVAAGHIEIARSIGHKAATVDPLAAGYAIGTVYTATLPDAYRRTRGSYYTPPNLTARLVDLATEAGVDWRTCTVLDPACGGGAFLAPVALRIIAELGTVSPRRQLEAVEKRLTGYEIDPFAAWISRVLLEAALMDVMRASRRRLKSIVQVRDSIANPENPSRFDLVIGNPPYGRLQLSSELRFAYRRSLHGHANVYGVFTDLALRLAAPNGIISFVTPTSFLSGQYFSALRSLLTEIARPTAIEFVSDRKGVFDDVLQETVLAAFRVGARNGKTSTRYLTISGAEEVAAEDGGQHSIPRRSGEPWHLPRNPNLTVIARRLSHLRWRLKDYGYKVSTGPLVWNRHKQQLTEDQGSDCYPIVWAESVTQSGLFHLRADKRSHRPFLALRLPRDNWLLSDRPCVLVQRTTAKEQRRRIIAAHLPQDIIEEWKGVVVENHLNMIYRVSDATSVPLDVLTALLNSQALDLAFRCINGSVAVSAYELGALPVPDPEWVSGSLSDAVRGGSGRDIDQLLAEYYMRVRNG